MAAPFFVVTTGANQTMNPTPAELSTVILAITGVILQLILRNVPTVSTWYQAQPNKGTLALILVTLVGCVYAGLSCSPYAGQLNIGVACTTDGVFAVARAVFILATSQQLTYLYTRSGA